MLWTLTNTLNIKTGVPFGKGTDYTAWELEIKHFFDRVYYNLHNVLENHRQLNPCSDDLIFYILQSDIKHILIQKGSNLEF